MDRLVDLIFFEPHAARIFFTRSMGHWLRNNLGVFLDIEGAFDNTSFEPMDDAASDHGVCSTINRCIDFMLRSRSVFVEIRGVRVDMSVQRGYSQRVYNRTHSGIW
jgi:hypothetical protein